MKYLTIYTAICFFRLWYNGCPSGRNDCAAPHWWMYWYSDNMWSIIQLYVTKMHVLYTRQEKESPHHIACSLIVVSKFGLRPTVYIYIAVKCTCQDFFFFEETCQDISHMVYGDMETRCMSLLITACFCDTWYGTLLHDFSQRYWTPVNPC